jgi:hypothetical protein
VDSWSAHHVAAWITCRAGTRTEDRPGRSLAARRDTRRTLRRLRAPERGLQSPELIGRYRMRIGGLRQFRSATGSAVQMLRDDRDVAVEVLRHPEAQGWLILRCEGIPRVLGEPGLLDSCSRELWGSKMNLGHPNRSANSGRGSKAVSPCCTEPLPAVHQTGQVNSHGGSWA